MFFSRRFFGFRRFNAAIAVNAHILSLILRIPVNAFSSERDLVIKNYDINADQIRVIFKIPGIIRKSEVMSLDDAVDIAKQYKADVVLGILLQFLILFE